MAEWIRGRTCRERDRGSNPGVAILHCCACSSHFCRCKGYPEHGSVPHWHYNVISTSMIGLNAKISTQTNSVWITLLNNYDKAGQNTESKVASGTNSNERIRRMYNYRPHDKVRSGKLHRTHSLLVSRSGQSACLHILLPPCACETFLKYRRTEIACTFGWPPARAGNKSKYFLFLYLKKSEHNFVLKAWFRSAFTLTFKVFSLGKQLKFGRRWSTWSWTRRMKRLKSGKNTHPEADKGQ